MLVTAILWDNSDVIELVYSREHKVLERLFIQIRVLDGFVPLHLFYQVNSGFQTNEG